MYIVWLFSGLVSTILLIGAKDLTAYRPAAAPLAIILVVGFLYFTIGRTEAGGD